MKLKTSTAGVRDKSECLIGFNQWERPKPDKWLIIGLEMDSVLIPRVIITGNKQLFLWERTLLFKGKYSYLFNNFFTWGVLVSSNVRSTNKITQVQKVIPIFYGNIWALVSLQFVYKGLNILIPKCWHSNDVIYRSSRLPAYLCVKIPTAYQFKIEVRE